MVSIRDRIIWSAVYWTLFNNVFSSIRPNTYSVFPYLLLVLSVESIRCEFLFFFFPFGVSSYITEKYIYPFVDCTYTATKQNSNPENILHRTFNCKTHLDTGNCTWILFPHLSRVLTVGKHSILIILSFAIIRSPC